MHTNKPLISLVIPLYNEEDNLKWHHSKIVAFLNEQKLIYEIIYIDDGSTDNSMKVIKELAALDTKVQYIGLSRNFGKEAATTAGLKASRGDVVVLIDADGQHPIELVEDFLIKWHDGYEVIIGVREANTNEGFVKRYGSKLHNWLMSTMANSSAPAGSTDFRLIDRKVVDEFNKLTERNRITRGLIDWLGFKRTYVSFISPARHSGVAKYSFRKLIKLALHSFTSQTTKPLQLTGFLGFIVTVMSLLIGIFLVTEKYLLGDPIKLAITGSALLAVFLSFLVGIVLICQWLLAIYIESIHNETQNRPLFIISEQSK